MRNARQQDEETRKRQQEEEQSRQRSPVATDESEEAFDPHAILNVPRDAGKEAIDAAYQEGQRRYAPEHVAHLGPELQEHFKRKAEAVERAYRILTE